MKIKRFLEIEKKYDLYNLKEEGINYWMYERFGFWNYTICSVGMDFMSSAPIKKTSVAGRIKECFCLVWNIMTNSYVPKGTFDICFVAHPRRVKNGEFYECIYTEKLMEYFTDSVTLEEPYMRKHFKPVKSKKVIYTDYILALGEMSALLHEKFQTKRYKRIYSSIVCSMEAALQEMLDEYKVDIDLKKIYGIFTRRTINMKLQKKLFKFMLTKMNPKLIVEVTHYDHQCLMINEIAKELGIETLELQHGTMHDEHAAYQYGTNQPLPQLPDKILTFSEFWSDIIHMPNEACEIIPVGYPYYEQQVQKFKKANANVADKKNILFLSQGTIGVYLSKLAIELSEIIDKERYHIIYKLHPAEYADWRQRYGELENYDITIVDNNEINLYEWFAKSSVQVGAYSTAIYEGLGFGLLTCIYNIAHADTMKRLVDYGCAYYVNNGMDIVNIIEKQADSNIKTELFWKKNAFENITKYIEKELQSIC